MKKYVLDLTVTDSIRISADYVHLKMTHLEQLPPMLPGQFAMIKVDGSATTFLRRPISINYLDRLRNEVWFLVRLAGDGTRKMAELKVGDKVNAVLPLGNTFTIPEKKDTRVLLTGGGVGVAPMLMLGDTLLSNGIPPVFLLGAKTKADLLELPLFHCLGDVFVTTEDGSMGERGYLTMHSLLREQAFDFIYSCGPKPMMMAVARYAKERGIECEVSLENMMVCGVGACLCCVENTTEGHLCVCKDGPVLNVRRLLWQI